MNLFNELQNLMAKYRFRANRKLSQNFVINEHLIEKIVELADLKASDTVLEIGAGTGFLTKALLKKSKVIAVEKDKGLCKVLEEELSQKNLTLILGDFLKETISKYMRVPAVARAHDLIPPEPCPSFSQPAFIVAPNLFFGLLGFSRV